MTTQPPALRILVLATTFPAVAGDGTPEFVLTLAREMVRRGHEVSVVAPRVPGSARSEVMGGVRVVRFPYFFRRWEDLAAGAIVPNLKRRPSRWFQVVPLVVGLWWAARRESRRTRADVVHAHWIIPAAFVARTVGRPYVVTVHGADAYALSAPMFQWAKRVALSRAEAVVPVSRPIGERVRGFGCTPVAEVPMGVDVDEIRRAVGPRRPTRGRVLFVGRLVDKKGVDDLIRALPALPGASVRVVGDGPGRPSLEELANLLGVGDRVHFLGQCPRDVVLAEMSSAAVVALPSKPGEGGDEDGVPVVLPEALAAGVPVVVTTAGGLADHVQDGVSGWVVPAGSPADLARAIGEALADPPGAERRAASAAASALSAFRIERVGDEYERLLARVVR